MRLFRCGGSLVAPFYRRLLRVFTFYGVLSMVTLPFLNAVWLGEVPLLALIQLPKVMLARWLRVHVVMAALPALGLSRGSFSPDYLFARPYGLALAYLLAVGLLLLPAALGLPFAKPARRWALLLLVVAAADYVATLFMAGGPGLTVY